MNSFGCRGLQECSTQLSTGKHLSEFGENLKMLLGGNFWHEQEHQHANRLAIGSVEGHRLRQPNERGHCFFETFEPTVRHGNTMSQCGRSQSLACKEAVEDL